MVASGQAELSRGLGLRTREHRFGAEHRTHDLDDAGVEYLLESKVSIYFRDPDGTRLELLADPLGEMYGSKVL